MSSALYMDLLSLSEAVIVGKKSCNKYCYCLAASGKKAKVEKNSMSLPSTFGFFVRHKADPLWHSARIRPEQPRNH